MISPYNVLFYLLTYGWCIGVFAALIYGLYAVRTALGNQRRAVRAQEQLVELLREQNTLLQQSAGKP